VAIEQTLDIAKIAQKYINATNRSIFLTGKAGTGKTTFLKHIVQHTHKNTIVAAPTGIAAINAGGVTLHSLLQLPFGTFIPDNNATFAGYSDTQINTPKSLLSKLQLNQQKRAMLREMELLIIDEVSMLRPDILDAIDTILRSVRRNATPFGGTQLLFIGDLLQLPPVIKDSEWAMLQSHYKSKYFFSAHVLSEKKPAYLELEKIYRQSDHQFISILNNLRSNAVCNEDISFLNNYYRPDFQADPEQAFINLTTHNKKADSINSNSLQKLDGKEYCYRAEIEGDFPPHTFPIEENLVLKSGAQVMFIKNDPSGQQLFFNGKIGKISSLNNKSIQVSFPDGSPTVDVEKYTWENKRYTLDKTTNEIEEKIIGRFTHYPLRLAWAITIHKSQGLTFEKAILDVSDAFAPGQVYVALSRLTSLKGLILSAPFNKQSFGANGAIKEFSENRLSPKQQNNDLEQSSASYLREYVISSFGFGTLLWHIENHVKSYNKNESQSAKQKYKKWAERLLEKFRETKAISDKFSKQLNAITLHEKINFPFLIERLSSALTFFDSVFDEYEKAITSHIAELSERIGTKGYQNELKDLRTSFLRSKMRLHKAKALATAISCEQELSKNDIRSLIPQQKEKKSALKAKKEKVDTKEHSIQLHLAGHSIEKIAELRGVRAQTIENHLSWGIQQGRIKASDFLDAQQIEEIIATAERLDTQFLSPLKDEFGTKYSYTDLRMAMAHKLFTEKQ